MDSPGTRVVLIDFVSCKESSVPYNSSVISHTEASKVLTLLVSCLDIGGCARIPWQSMRQEGSTGMEVPRTKGSGCGVVIKSVDRERVVRTQYFGRWTCCSMMGTLTTGNM